MRSHYNEKITSGSSKLCFDAPQNVNFAVNRDHQVYCKGE